MDQRMRKWMNRTLQKVNKKRKKVEDEKPKGDAM